MLEPERLDQTVEVAVHHGVEPVERHVDTMVGNPALWKVVGADPLRAITTADLALAGGGLGSTALVCFRGEEPR